MLLTQFAVDIIAPALTLLGFVLLGAGIAFSLAAAMIAWGARRPRRATAGWALAHGFPPDPAACGLEFTEVGNARMPVWRVRCHGGDSAPDLVLLHGWGRSRIDSLRRLQPWLGQCRVAYLPDLPGHGDSEARTGVGAFETRDVITLVHSIGSKSSDGDARRQGVILAGHSMGGSIAIRAAAALARERLIASTVAWAPYETARHPIQSRLATHGIRIPGLARAAEWVLRARTGSEPSTDAALRSLTKQGERVILVAGAADRIVPQQQVNDLLALDRGGHSIVASTADHAMLGTPDDPTSDEVVLKAIAAAHGDSRSPRSLTE